MSEVSAHHRQRSYSSISSVERKFPSVLGYHKYYHTCDVGIKKYINNCNLLNLQSYLQSVYLVSLPQSVLSEQFHRLVIKLSTANNHVFMLHSSRGRQKLVSPHGSRQDSAA